MSPENCNFDRHHAAGSKNHYDINCTQYKPGCNDILNNSYYKSTEIETDYFSEKIDGKPLYRYCGVNDYLLSDLSEGVSLLKISRFNDLYDSTITTKDVNGQWYIDCGANSRYYCRCFSECNDSIHMWSHYADSNKGVCIEYDPSPYGCCFYKVKYESQPIDYSPLEDIKSGQLTDKNMLSMLIKSDIWEKEKEWRIITDLLMDEGHFPKIQLPIRRIYFGCEFGSEMKTNDIHYEYVKKQYARLRSIIIKKKIITCVGKIPANSYSIVFDECRIQDLIEEDGTPTYDVVNGRRDKTALF